MPFNSLKVVPVLNYVPHHEDILGSGGTAMHILWLWH